VLGLLEQVLGLLEPVLGLLERVMAKKTRPMPLVVIYQMELVQPQQIIIQLILRIHLVLNNINGISK
jgi:hypothetical protein